MTDDPIIEELHKIREEMLEEHGGLDGLVKHLQKLQSEHPERFVKLEPKPPAKVRRKIS